MSVKQGAKLAVLGRGAESTLVTEPGHWTKTHTPAVATQATITKAAGAADEVHVCKGVSASIACGATAQTPIIVNLKDGTNVVKSWALSAPVSGCAAIEVSGLSIVGTPGTAMTLEFAAAGVAASQEVVNLEGYTVNG